jgi:predicted transcriptional regulator
MPDQAGLAILTLQLEDSKGGILHRNFMHFEILSDKKAPKLEMISVAPNAFSNASFSKKQWNILDGLKVNGAGEGFFEYTFPLGATMNVNAVKEAYFLVEISAKELFVKDQDVKERTDVNFMLGAKASPSGNPNAYPMTDEKTFPSKVMVLVDGKSASTTTLPDDPADHRGVLSWHHQLKDKKLREAGSYGYLTKVPITKAQLKNALRNGKLVIQIKTIGDGGIAVYGKSFGRYPVDPSLILQMR